MFVGTSILLSRQKDVFCRDKHVFVMFVGDKYLSRQTFCCDKNMFVATKEIFCRDKTLSRQKWYLWQLPPMIDSPPHRFQSLSSQFPKPQQDFLGCTRSSRMEDGNRKMVITVVHIIISTIISLVVIAISVIIDVVIDEFYSDG